jgi:hypothetical protein
MRMAIEQAGAERGLLILTRGGEQRIAAEATTSGDTVDVQPRDMPVSEAMLPESVLYYVLHTRDSIILGLRTTAAPRRYSKTASGRKTLRSPGGYGPPAGTGQTNYHRGSPGSLRRSGSHLQTRLVR